MHVHDNNVISQLLLKMTITHACDLYTSFVETCRDMLKEGVGGAEDVVWSSVVSLWQERYGDMLFSCFYDFTEHEESICVQVRMYAQFHVLCTYVGHECCLH